MWSLALLSKGRIWAKSCNDPIAMSYATIKMVIGDLQFTFQVRFVDKTKVHFPFYKEKLC